MTRAPAPIIPFRAPMERWPFKYARCRVDNCPFGVSRWCPRCGTARCTEHAAPECPACKPVKKEGATP